GNGIVISSGGTGYQILGNWIGVDANGNPLGNGVGIDVLAGSQATIGDTNFDDGNVISANTYDGISLESDNNIVQGNFIGTNTTGQVASGFGNYIGVSVDGSNNVVGASGSPAGTPGQQPPDPAGNIIAGNKNSGVNVGRGTNNRINLNTIFADGNLGIDLGDFKITAPSSQSGWQNYPILYSVQDTNGGVTVMGTLLPNGQGPYRIEFYANS